MSRTFAGLRQRLHQDESSSALTTMTESRNGPQRRANGFAMPGCHVRQSFSCTTNSPLSLRREPARLDLLGLGLGLGLVESLVFRGYICSVRERRLVRISADVARTCLLPPTRMCRSSSLGDPRSGCPDGVWRGCSSFAGVSRATGGAECSTGSN